MEMCGRSGRRRSSTVRGIAQRNLQSVAIEIAPEELGHGGLSAPFRALSGLLNRVDRLRIAAVFRIGSGEKTDDHQVAATGNLSGALRQIESARTIANRRLRRGRQNPSEGDDDAGLLGMPADGFPPLGHGGGQLTVAEQTDRQVVAQFGVIRFDPEGFSLLFNRALDLTFF